MRTTLAIMNWSLSKLRLALLSTGRADWKETDRTRERVEERGLLFHLCLLCTTIIELLFLLLLLGWLFNIPAICNACVRDGSAQTIWRAATQRHNLKIKRDISPSHSILTPGQPDLPLTLYRQPPGRSAKRVPMFKSLKWLDRAGVRGAIPVSPVLVADTSVLSRRTSGCNCDQLSNAVCSIDPPGHNRFEASLTRGLFS